MNEQIEELDRLHEAVKQAVYKKIDAAANLAATNSDDAQLAYRDAYFNWHAAREAYMRAAGQL